MGITAVLNNAVYAIGLKKRTGQELLDHALSALNEILEERNTCGNSRVPRILRSSSPPILYPITMEVTSQDDLEARGIFHVENSMTEVRDEIDFSAHVEIDADTGEEKVIVRMPHWQFPYPITDNVDRMCLQGFLIAEAEERAGLDASLRLNGL